MLKDNINIEKESCFFTPKRITVIFYGLKLEVGKSKDFIKGPSYNSSEKAVDGFAKNHLILLKKKLIIRETEKG